MKAFAFEGVDAIFMCVIKDHKYFKQIYKFLIFTQKTHLQIDLKRFGAKYQLRKLEQSINVCKTHLNLKNVSYQLLLMFAASKIWFREE
ncbi:CLUMA_CG003106, isoform A [Clunio marinus]|uniref:CLUMA_CG003106, isoform A n=1 Tax=Clunio marinus TaxID=568069 RepID=A0A1J1HPN0_9DIPT|nr:CLUMA_CG003106, isoform A [Clunio marinus]